MLEIAIISDIAGLPIPLAKIISSYIHYIAIKIGINIYIFDGKEIRSEYTIDDSLRYSNLMIMDHDIDMEDLETFHKIDLEKGFENLPDQDEKSSKRQKVDFFPKIMMENGLEPSFICLNKQLYGINKDKLKVWNSSTKTWSNKSSNFHLNKYSKISFWRNYLLKVDSFGITDGGTNAVTITFFNINSDKEDITTFPILDIFIYEISITVHEDDLYIFGGKTFIGITLFSKNVFCFNLVDKTVRKCDDIPGSSGIYTSARLGNYIYLFSKYRVSENNTYKYDVVNNKWSSIEDVIPKNSIFSVMSY